MPLYDERGRLPAVLEPSAWQMMIGDRAGLEGLLAAVRPELAIEIGTAEGGSLARIAHYAREVHSFDLVPPDPAFADGLDNVTLHTGDSREVLPPYLAELAAAGRNVDFVLVDGCHEHEFVKADVEHLLASPAVGQTVMVMHDTANEACRGGLEAVDWESHDKVRWVELDCIAGYLFRGPMAGELWGGLGVAIIDDQAGPPGTGPRRPDRTEPTAQQLWLARDAQGLRERLARAEAERDAARGELEYLRGVHHAVTSSPSWRMTAPLRRAKAALRRSGR